MNNNLYNNGAFMPNQIIDNHHYVENFLKKNIGKVVEVHASFCDSIEWRDSIFTGIMEDIGKDYIVINDNSKKYIVWSIYLDYIIIKS